MSLSSLLKDRRLWLVLVAVGAFSPAALVRPCKLSLARHPENASRSADELGAGKPCARKPCLHRGLRRCRGLFGPGAVFLTLSGGFLFGATLGTLLTVTGATIGATLVFLFAKALLGEKALDRFGAPAAKLAEGIRRNAGAYLLVLRLVPLFPFFLVNLVPAFVGVKLLTYVVTTFVGIIPARRSSRLPARVWVLFWIRAVPSHRDRS